MFISRRRVAHLLAASLVSVTLIGVHTHPAVAEPATERIAGSDRFATAAALSAAMFDPGVPTVHIATGVAFPDALAAGPAAAFMGGPVLLVEPGRIPEATRSELQRLDADEIVVLGGASAVSDAVKDELGQFTDGPVARIAGSDRFATAAATSAATFPPHTPSVFVASGAGFADALGGGVAAAITGSPLLLVGQDEVPGPTETELDRLQPESVVVLGGSAAVSERVEDRLADITGASVLRYAGADRFDTSVEISRGILEAFGASTVYIATGLSFPDALAAAGAAGMEPGPVLLVPGNCMTTSVDEEIDRLAPERLLVLGGPAAVSDAAAARSSCTPDVGTEGPSGWLATLNAYRALGRLPAVTENPAWTEGEILHSRYSVMNDELGHSEDPSNEWYTPEGDEAANNGIPWATFETDTTEREFIERQMTTVFHRLNLVAAELRQSAFGAFVDPNDSGLRWAGTIDTIRGLGDVPAEVKFPVTWPSNGAGVPLGELEEEVPDVLESCPGYTAPAGLPVTVQFASEASVESSSFTRDGQPLEHCVFDSQTFSFSDSSWQQLGRDILAGYNAAALIPREPLEVGATYTASITSGGVTASSTFTITDGDLILPQG